MKKSMSQRRVPRKIGGDDEDEHMSSGSADTGSESTESAIKRPNKPRKSTHLRKSFGPTAIQDDDEDDNDTTSPASVVTPKRSSNLSKLAVQRNASKRSSFLPSDLPSDSQEDSRPSYSASDLQALRNSTPSTPQQLDPASSSNLDAVAASAQALDLNSKFGSSLARYQPSPHNSASAIPSAAEIEEKKARRARLALESKADEFISLDPDEPGFDEDEDGNVTRDDAGRLILRPKDGDKYGMAESRLVRDDEDLMEGFDEFTGETGARVRMDESTRGGERERRKADMAAQIAAAEAEEDSEEGDESERERYDAFEAAQTRRGDYGRRSRDEEGSAHARPRTPPKIAPLPSLDGAIGRLRGALEALQMGRMEKVREMEGLAREKARIGEEEVRVQKALRETSEKFEALRRERGIVGGGGSAVEMKEGTPVLGLEGRGENGVGKREEERDGDADEEEEDDRPRSGLGMAMGMAGRGLESLGASPGANTPTERAQSEQAMED